MSHVRAERRSRRAQSVALPRQRHARDESGLLARPFVPVTELLRRQEQLLAPGAGADVGEARPSASERRSRRVERKPRLDERKLILLADLTPLVLVTVVPWLLVVASLGVAMVLWLHRGAYRRRISLSVTDDLPSLALGGLLGIPVTVLAAISLGLPVAVGYLVPVGMTVVVLAARVGVYTVIRNQRVIGRLGYTTVLVGGGSAGRDLARRIDEHPELGLKVVGLVGTGMQGSSLPVVGAPGDLCEIIARLGVSHVVVGHGGASSSALVGHLRVCQRADVDVYVLPRLYELHPVGRTDDQIWGLPLVRVSRPHHSRWGRRLKRVFDVVVASLALAIAWPLMLAVALAVRLELGRGVIFRQPRVGMHGKPIVVFKFRSMPAAPREQSTRWSVDPETELCRLSRLIRRYSLDELPQLLNVLRGEMSIVGPRPERPEFVETFVATVPRYGDRHRVPVGLTGLAAVKGLRGDTSIRDRAHFDNWYVENWSLWLDLKIVALTVLSVARGTGQ